MVSTSNPRTGSIALALFALLVAAPGAGAQPLAYPPTPRDNVEDDYHGTRVPDPYRWLERLDDRATIAWVDAQSRLTHDVLARLPERAAIGRRLESLWSFNRTDVPWREAGRLFFVESRGLQRQPVLYVQASPADSPRVVLDPQQLSSDGSLACGDYAVSPDGRWISYSSSKGGADIGEMRVRDLVTARDREDVVHGAWGGASWTFDGGGYFYMRPPEPRPGEPPGAPRMEKQLLYHALGTPQSSDRLVRAWTDGVRWLYTMMSDDGRFAIIVAERGSNSRMYVMDLGNPRAPNLAAPVVPLLADREARYTPMGTVGTMLYVFADLDAPRGRVLALDLAAGARAKPRPVIAESKAVIQWATVAGDRLALHVLEDVQSHLRLYTLDGRLSREVELPGIGALGWPINGRHSAAEVWYSFTSFLSPATVYRADVESGVTEAFRPPRVPYDPAPYETRQIFFSSKDGTRVPVFVTAHRGLSLDGSHPVLLTGYGGFGTIVGPAYRPDIPLWLEAGGVYAVANLRGGGEYGEAWHRAGSLEHKQNSFDDFIGAAEALIDLRYTSKAKLAIYGHSNGGLLVGAVMTQRPDLFEVAVPNAGHYDMLRFHRFTVGGGWIPEYGSPDSAAMFPVLAAYSPLHRVRAGTCYPATLLLAADHDDRVVPSHAYKFAATLQAAQACERPILLRVARDASHSYESATESVAELTDMWAFIAARLGVSLPGPARRAGLDR
jgi:prolyl oligopeptidase